MPVITGYRGAWTDCGSLRRCRRSTLPNAQAVEDVVQNTLNGLPFQTIERAKDGSDRLQLAICPACLDMSHGDTVPRPDLAGNVQSSGSSALRRLTNLAFASDAPRRA